ncbi:pilus assembly protein TadG-related protein [Kitasatospora sp. NPDC049285]|uniref:pilus assembly protein TadG-related protein n=1 Tax=Kitasatospora sp. NPDC049285 TaxID=3157096 RepID=UPI00342E9CDE
MTGRTRLAERLRRLREHSDRGSGALALLMAAVLFVVIAGFIVDTGRAIHQRELAADAAEQAARYAANHISTDALRNQGTVTVDATTCTSNVRAYVRATGFSGADADSSGCTQVSGNTVSVRVRLTYTPLLLAMGNGDVTVWGNATAQAVQEQ